MCTTGESRDTIRNFQIPTTVKSFRIIGSSLRIRSLVVMAHRSHKCINRKHRSVVEATPGRPTKDEIFEKGKAGLAHALVLSKSRRKAKRLRWHHFYALAQRFAAVTLDADMHRTTWQPTFNSFTATAAFFSLFLIPEKISEGRNSKGEGKQRVRLIVCVWKGGKLWVSVCKQKQHKCSQGSLQFELRNAEPSA